MIVQEGEAHYYLDDTTYHTLIKKRKLIRKKDNDYLMLVCGDTGTGKSTLAFQLAKAVDPSFNLSRVAFTPQNFAKVISHATPGQAVLFDEAFSGLSSMGAGKRDGMYLKNIIMECRQRRLFIIIVLPSLWALDKYVLLERAKTCFVTYIKKDRRGQCAVFDRNGIKWLELRGRKARDYHVTSPRYRFRFSGSFSLDKYQCPRIKTPYGLISQVEFDYREMKSRALKAKIDAEGGNPLEKSDRLTKLMDQRAALFHICVEKGVTTKEIVERLNEIALGFGTEAAAAIRKRGAELFLPVDLKVAGQNSS